MIWLVSLNPMFSICLAVRVSTGTAASDSVPGAREPTVISSVKV